jgi:hypothetical protein
VHVYVGSGIGALEVIEQEHATLLSGAAAHPPPLLWRRRRQALEKLAETGLLLGGRPNGPYADNQFSSEIGDHLALHGCLLEVENAGQSFGGAVQPTFIQEKIHEKQDLGTEQFADLLLNEVLAWSRNGTSRGRKTISQCGSLIFMGCGLELKGKSSFRSLSVARSH